MHTSRIKQTISYTFRDPFIGDLFQYVPHWLTRPNCILAYRSLCQDFANPEITNFASCQFLAFSTHASYPIQELLCINVSLLIAARYACKLVEKIDGSIGPFSSLFRPSRT